MIVCIDRVREKEDKFLDSIYKSDSNNSYIKSDIVDLANQNKGDHAFVVHIPSEEGEERKIISKKIKVSNNNQFLILLRDLLGDSNVWIA